MFDMGGGARLLGNMRGVFLINLRKQYMLTVFGKTNQLARKTSFFLLLCYLLRPAKILPSKFEANLMLRLRVHDSFSLFPLASSCLNEYFRSYTIIDFLCNQLVFLNMVTYKVSNAWLTH